MNNENRITNNRIPEGEVCAAFCLFLSFKKSSYRYGFFVLIATCLLCIYIHQTFIMHQGLWPK